jgi:hypothetical protein
VFIVESNGVDKGTVIRKSFAIAILQAIMPILVFVEE